MVQHLSHVLETLLNQYKEVNRGFAYLQFIGFKHHAIMTLFFQFFMQKETEVICMEIILHFSIFLIMHTLASRTELYSSFLI